MKRTKLRERCLPSYTQGEEIFNAISHGCGILLGITILILCIIKTRNATALSQISTGIYGISMIILYTVSMLYHAWKPSIVKRVFQILDHCTIYLLIAGTYTPIMMLSIYPNDKLSACSIMALQWGISALLITLNAIDLSRFKVFSYIGYIVLGWAVLFILPLIIKCLSSNAFLYILLGGISYTIGAILFAIGAKKRWFHSIFHLFVLIGSLLQFIGIYQYIL